MSIDFAPFAYPVLRDDTLRDAEERARVHGHAAGYAAGRRDAAELLAAEREHLHREHEHGLADARRALADATRAVTLVAARLAAQTAPVLADADHALLTAATQLAEDLLGQELRESAAGMQRIRQVLASVEDEVIQAVRLCPSDAALLASSPAPLVVHVLPDSRLSPGDAIVVLADGILDARIGAALQRARAALGEAQ
ncbi:MAG: hypothetical protein JWR33_1710 [Naasia sp.]|jgi:flagellar assembly protein FliH|uniref:FliH/SctL family protein n=1 Tax=Naasia sp. TaxID=2546198 RepID=UPI0026358FC7|nr:FliH/SctL family protein [Naasia sp.]MCU1570969.1 hypothetical protein [Naasia sp.]